MQVDQNLTLLLRSLMQLYFLSMRLFITLTAIHVLLAAGAACQTRELSVGVILPLSGPVAGLASEVREGIEAAERAVEGNASLTRKIRAIYQDSKCVPREAMNAYQLLYSRGVRVIIGELCSPSTLALAPVAERNSVLLLTPGSSAATISQSGDFIFRLHSRVDLEIHRLVSWVSPRFKRIAFLYDTSNDAMQQAVEYFRKEFNGTLIEVPFRGGSESYQSEIVKLKGLDVDAVHVEALSADLLSILRAMRQLSIRKPVTTNKSAASSEFLSNAGTLAEGLTYPIAEYDEKTNPVFWRQYRQLHQKDPTVFSAQGYDAFIILAEAMNRCSDDTGCIKKALYELHEYPGASGTLRFDSNGDVEKTIAIMRVADGRNTRID